MSFNPDEVIRHLFSVPLPPSANRMWRFFRGRPVLSAEARKYKQDVSRLCAERGGFGQPYPADVPIALYLTFYMERVNGDVSNRIKVLEDAMNGVVYEDDVQVVEIHVYRQMAEKPRRGKRAGYVEVMVIPHVKRSPPLYPVAHPHTWE